MITSCATASIARPECRDHGRAGDHGGSRGRSRSRNAMIKDQFMIMEHHAGDHPAVARNAVVKDRTMITGARPASERCGAGGGPGRVQLALDGAWLPGQAAVLGDEDLPGGWVGGHRDSLLFGCHADEAEPVRRGGAFDGGQVPAGLAG
jgi:hypothetical protein